jgi:SAM-dependent methyltransferase
MTPRVEARQLAMRLLPFYRRSVEREKRLQRRLDDFNAAALTIPQLCADEAGRYRVNPKIHSNDFIFQYILGRNDEVKAAVKRYFDTGNMSAAKLLEILFNEIKFDKKPISLLEFASGYGCVSRHLKRSSEQIDLWASDIHEEAKDFYVSCLGIKFIQSTRAPSEFDPSMTFDAVFALSFFSHMPEASWGQWLRKLFACVKPGGSLIFTTHGIISNQGLKGFPENGFKFEPLSEQKDLSVYEYGYTCTTPGFVRREVSKLESEEIVLFREGDWWGHQDLYVVRKRP